jgi:hypothetical protein
VDAGFDSCFLGVRYSGFLFVPLSLSALQKRFFLLEKDTRGKKDLREIQIEKAGLLYDIIRWHLPKNIVLEQ